MCRVGLGPPQNDIAMAWWAKAHPTVQIAAKRDKCWGCVGLVFAARKRHGELKLPYGLNRRPAASIPDFVMSAGRDHKKILPLGEDLATAMRSGDFIREQRHR